MATIREFFQNLLYQVPAIGITDIVDILVVSIIFYSLLRLIRSTSAARVARAILLLLAITLLTDVLNLYTLNWLLNKILEVGAIALIIVFQPELRRALERVGAQLHFHLLSTESAASINVSKPWRYCLYKGSSVAFWRFPGNKFVKAFIWNIYILSVVWEAVIERLSGSIHRYGQIKIKIIWSLKQKLHMITAGCINNSSMRLIRNCSSKKVFATV